MQRLKRTVQACYASSGSGDMEAYHEAYEQLDTTAREVLILRAGSSSSSKGGGDDHVLLCKSEHKLRDLVRRLTQKVPHSHVANLRILNQTDVYVRVEQKYKVESSTKKSAGFKGGASGVEGQVSLEKTYDAPATDVTTLTVS